MGIVVISGPFRKPGKTNRYCKAICQACNKEFDTIWDRKHVTKSCGCMRPKPSRMRHGHCMKTTGVESSTYRSWRAAHGRCCNPNDKMFHRYGGRGITMCERWQDFANFLADMPEKPAGATIERIDSSKGYEPGNCRWATRKEQNRNKSNNRMLTIYGATKCLGEWVEIAGESYSKAKQRLKRGWTHKESVFGRSDNANGIGDMRTEPSLP